MIKTPSQEPSLQLPPLENGDRLSRYEFERRYNAMPHLKKAELIEGVVYMPAALRFRSHGRPHALLMASSSEGAGDRLLNHALLRA